MVRPCIDRRDDNRCDHHFQKGAPPHYVTISLSSVLRDRHWGTGSGMLNFDVELYFLVCQSLEERFGESGLEDFDLHVKRPWLIRLN
jgi:hypothetical protein